MYKCFFDKEMALIFMDVLFSKIFFLSYNNYYMYVNDFHVMTYLKNKIFWYSVFIVTIKY